VELVIDDTPLVVKVSSFDPERRFIATETLKKLLKDGRINPVYVEKIYNETLENFDEVMIQK
jgi:ribonuclease Y